MTQGEEKSGDPQNEPGPDREPKEQPPVRRRLPWSKRLLFLAFFLFFLFLLVECGLRIAKNMIRPDTTATGQESDCESIVFLCIGDSMTFGLGAERNESYPSQLPKFFTRRFPGLQAKVYNLGVAGTNTSEGINNLENFLKTYPDAFPDFALIMYGVNNRWNLHNASFWDWDEDAKKNNYLDYLASRFQTNKLFGIAKANRNDQLAVARKTGGKTYREMLDEHGWYMFFSSFSDDLLARWIEHDLLQMAEKLKSRGVEPIFLTYHYNRFDHLNDLIRQTAQKADVKLIDLEKPFNFYQVRRMYHDDNFHLNAKGYNALARRIVLGFGEHFIRFQLTTNIQAKELDDRCKSAQ